MSTKITKENTEEIIGLYLDGKNMTEIAKQFNVTSSAIKYWLNKVDIKTNPHPKRAINKEYDSAITDLFNANLYPKQIATKLGIGYSLVYKRLKDLGFNINSSNSKRIYPINQNFFEKIDSEEKAYFLGLLYADGNVRKKRHSFVTSIELVEEDKYLLDFLVSLIQPSKPLTKPKKRSNNHRQTYSILFSSKKMGEDLINLGCIPQKSLILNLPDFDQVPEHLFNHFIRGYFDGDGGFSHRGNGLKIKITSSNLFCSKLKIFFESISIKCFHYKTNKNTGDIVICSKENCLKFGEFIYSNASILMNRKLNKYLAFKEMNNY